jgi:hypothetical protein
LPNQRINPANTMDAPVWYMVEIFIFGRDLLMHKISFFGEKVNDLEKGGKGMRIGEALLELPRQID